MSEGAKPEPSGYALWRQEFPDYKLVADTGEEIPCHKVLYYSLDQDLLGIVEIS